MDDDGRQATELGPRHATPRQDPLSRLSGARAGVLERLCEFPEGVTVVDLSDACGQHPNTVREHLDALVRDGFATRTPAPARGRGRPALIYRGEQLRVSRPQDREYAVLADVLATHVEATESDVSAWGFASGERYGRSLVADPEPGIAAAEASARAILTHHHFDPVDAPDGTLRLRRCPRLDLALRHRDLVCSQHQGEIAGIYAAHGVAAERAMRIVPFALPGCCLVEFPPDPAAGPPVPPERPATRRQAGPPSPP